jgi:hypothetical protein
VLWEWRSLLAKALCETPVLLHEEARWRRCDGSGGRRPPASPTADNDGVAKLSADLSRVGRSLLRTARDPVVWVFVLAATFEVLTGDPLQ